MKMEQLIKIINAITNRATPYDICELLEEEYFSNSRQENIKYGDMDLFHFIYEFKEQDNKSKELTSALAQLLNNPQSRIYEKDGKTVNRVFINKE